MVHFYNSSRDKTLYWRIFKADDDANWFGDAEGRVGPGEETGWSDSTLTRIKVEAKWNSWMGDIVLAPTTVPMNHELWVDDHGLAAPDKNAVFKPPAASITLQNRALIPVHVAISWGGYVQQVKNHLMPNDIEVLSNNTNELGAELFDIAIFPGLFDNSEITEGRKADWNEKAVRNMSLAAGGALTAGIGIVATVATLGNPGVWTIVGAGATIAGSAIAAASLIAATSEVDLGPVYATGLVGRAPWQVQISGGLITATKDDDGDLVPTSATPIEAELVGPWGTQHFQST